MIKPGPWSQSQIFFFRDHESDIVHCKLSKGMTEDEMVVWHQRFNGHKFEQPPGDGERQGSLVCCSPWGCKESDTTEWLNNNKSQSPIKYTQHRAPWICSWWFSCPLISQTPDHSAGGRASSKKTLHLSPFPKIQSSCLTKQLLGNKQQTNQFGQASVSDDTHNS